MEVENAFILENHFLLDKQLLENAFILENHFLLDKQLLIITQV